MIKPKVVGEAFDAIIKYSFVNTNNTQTDITINTKFDSWNYNNDGIEQIMPWYSNGSQAPQQVAMPMVLGGNFSFYKWF
jgi:hypothetical protein